MQLTKFSDYALRVLMHLAASPEKLLSTRQISEMHGASFNHLTKVTGWLVTEGYAESVRGRSGGLRLARDPQDINLGEVLRKLEKDQPLVECFAAEGGSCGLASACGLSGVLWSAQEAFFQHLDGHTLQSTIDAMPRMQSFLVSMNEEINP
ncbi:HTH-type transcriptional repressor NsrR [Cognatishimia activa]|uniref:HTH-type transcriptional repressor NsrR n=1 Tax=Cognatishimia activa TaxID=1715691 RepID=A0A0P1JDU7_9RHOB|nr:Rrf2 family transcriptional regulator [Cognatishimia activa]CUK27510.1 HTH-type transcriptional repressor NsrR [Cognatishimia activa]